MKELARLGAKLGVELTPARVAIANGDFRGAQILSYGGRSVRSHMSISQVAQFYSAS